MDWHIFIKVATGVLIVPIAISAHKAWPWWTTQKSIPVKVVSGVFILPLVGVAAVVTPWWDGF
jgi:hypothetical protein